jgi:hypothetical protein
MKGWAQLSVHADTHTAVQNMAAHEGTSMAKIVTRAVEQYIEQTAPDLMSAEAEVT